MPTGERFQNIIGNICEVSLLIHSCLDDTGGEDVSGSERFISLEQ